MWPSDRPTAGITSADRTAALTASVTQGDRSKITEAGFDVRPGESPIVPVMLYNAKLAQDPDGLIVAVDKNGTVIGSVMSGYDGHRGWLYAVAVSPEHQGKRLGEALVRAALAAWNAGEGAVRRAGGQMPDSLEMKTMRPRLRDFMPGRKARDRRTPLITLVSKNRVQSASGIDSNALGSKMPRLFTRISTSPS